MRYLAIVAFVLATLTALGGAQEASAATTYYVDSVNGRDSYNGQFSVPCGPTCGPWQTLAKVNAKSSSSCSSNCLVAGDIVRFIPGSYFYQDATLELDKSGTSTSKITFEKYGSGTDPIIQGTDPCVDIDGNYVVLKNVNVTWCGDIGIDMSGDFNLLQSVTTQNNIVGLFIRGLSDNNEIKNSLIAHNQQGDGTGWSGVGILLHGGWNDIHHNTIRDNWWADSNDNGCRHGSGIELYGGDGEDASYNEIHHNLAYDNEAFSELGVEIDQNNGGSLGSAFANSYTFNIIRGSLAPTNCGSTDTCRDGWNGQAGLITRGDNEDPNPVEYGPVEQTTFNNNTLYFTGRCSQGVVCAGDCANPNEMEILTMKNNVVIASWKGAFIGDYGAYGWPVDSAYVSDIVDYNLFAETYSSEPGDAHCQFEGSSCPSQTHGITPYGLPAGGIAQVFKNAANWDLRPTCDSEGDPSPLLDSGADLGYTTDYAGTSIPQNGVEDIGAYERIC
jgi:hypothetical protein